MSCEIAIHCSAISKSYNLYTSNAARLRSALFRPKKQPQFQALKPIDLDIYRGDFFGIIGQNGSGKSTLLQIISGIIPSTTGTIAVQGRIGAMLELGAGFNPEFTGRENAFLNAQILGLSRMEITKAMPEIEKFADIGEFIDRPVMTYSSGMFVRLAFAVQTAIHPDILIIDEALAVGDIFFRKKCYDRLNFLKKNGVTVILVTHSVDDIMFYCNRALLLNKGEALFCGDPAQAINQYYDLGHSPSSFSDDVRDERISDCFFENDYLNIKWPHDGCFSHVSAEKQSGDFKVLCKKLRLQNTKGEATNIFRQGETMQILVEYETAKSIGTPCAGFVIRTDKGIVVHGKHTLQTNSNVPQFAAGNKLLRVVHEIKLDISVGEYLIDVGLSSYEPEIYEKRDFISTIELEDAAMRHSVITAAINFSVICNNGGGYAAQPFYGLAGISSSSHLILSGQDC